MMEAMIKEKIGLVPLKGYQSIFYHPTQKNFYFIQIGIYEIMFLYTLGDHYETHQIIFS